MFHSSRISATIVPIFSFTDDPILGNVADHGRTERDRPGRGGPRGRFCPTSSSPRSAVPSNLEAERALLGGMLLDNRKIGEILELIPRQARGAVLNGDSSRPGRRDRLDFVEPLFSHLPNQEIFEVVCRLYDRDHGVDLTTLGDELDRVDRYEAVGGPAYLASLEEEMVSTLFLTEYVRIVVEKWRLRTLSHTAQASDRGPCGS